MKTVGEDTAGWEKMQSHYKDEKMSREGKTHQEGSILLTSVVLFLSPPSLSLRRHNASWHRKVYPELNPTISDIAKGQPSFCLSHTLLLMREKSVGCDVCNYPCYWVFVFSVEGRSLTSLMMLVQSDTSVCVLVCVCVLGLKCWLPAMWISCNCESILGNDNHNASITETKLIMRRSFLKLLSWLVFITSQNLWSCSFFLTTFSLYFTFWRIPTSKLSCQWVWLVVEYTAVQSHNAWLRLLLKGSEGSAATL